MIKFINLKPSKQLRLQLDDAYNRVMSSGIYVRGSEVEAFEQEWADYNNAKYCISCGSGLDAIQLVLRAFDDVTYVRVPEWTAVSTWSAVQAANKKINIELKKGYAWIVVHLYGTQYYDCLSLYDSPVIQDCAQAHGLKLHHGICCWSFYPTKNLGAYGDGGAITINDEELANKLRLLRNHGCNDAINSRFDPLQAAFLRVKLPYLDEWNRQRQEFAQMYLEDLPLKIAVPQEKWNEAVWHQFVIQTKRRDELHLFLRMNGIDTVIHYPVPPHRVLGYNYDLPEADRLSREVLSLPIAPHLRDKDIKRVINTIWRFFE